MSAARTSSCSPPDKDSRCFDFGKGLTPEVLVRKVREQAGDWPYDAESLGYPGLVGEDGPTEEPENLGDGLGRLRLRGGLRRAGEDHQRRGHAGPGQLRGRPDALPGPGHAARLDPGRPESRDPARTGAATLPRRDVGGPPGGTRASTAAASPWEAVGEAVGILKGAFAADHVVLGGGNADRVDPLPEGVRRGGNENAFEGGFRLWETEVTHLDREDAAAEVVAGALGPAPEHHGPIRKGALAGEGSDGQGEELEPVGPGVPSGRCVAHFGLIDRSHSLRWASPRSQCVHLCRSSIPEPTLRPDRWFLSVCHSSQISQELDSGGEVALVDLGVTREGHFFSLGRR